MRNEVVAGKQYKEREDGDTQTDRKWQPGLVAGDWGESTDQKGRGAVQRISSTTAEVFPPSKDEATT